MKTKKATLIALGLFSAALIWSVLAHLSPKTDSERAQLVRTSPLDFEPSPEQLETVAILKSRVSKENPHFSAEDSRRREHAKLFTYMAATSDEPHVVQGSLEAILVAYSSRSSKKEAPDADLEKVLLKHLASQENEILAQALAAARIPLMSEDPGDLLPAALVRLASPGHSPEKRRAALEALNLLAPRTRNEKVLACFQETLGAQEPYLIAEALFALENSALSFGDPPGPTPELSHKVRALTEHMDPNVRGRALSVLTTLRWLTTASERVALGMRGLSDPHPYVRALAADLLGQNGQPEAVHALILHTQDMQVARASISYPKLDGTVGEMVHVLPGRKRVAEAALYALIALSTDELALAIGGPHQSEETIRNSAQVAERWYEKAKAHLPPPEAGTVR